MTHAVVCVFFLPRRRTWLVVWSFREPSQDELSRELSSLQQTLGPRWKISLRPEPKVKVSTGTSFWLVLLFPPTLSENFVRVRGDAGEQCDVTELNITTSVQAGVKLEAFSHFNNSIQLIFCVAWPQSIWVSLTHRSISESKASTLVSRVYHWTNT